MVVPTERGFLSSNRYALKHLYDPDVSRRSPLIEMLGIPSRTDTASALRQALIQAIRSLEPDLDTPTHSHGWRVYEILLYRYIQQCSQQEVADQFAISVRHLRREERRALEVLAHRLEQEFDVEIDSGEGPLDQEPTFEPNGSSSAADSELAWLEQVPPAKPP